jgi:hypothetical protein
MKAGDTCRLLERLCHLLQHLADLGVVVLDGLHFQHHSMCPLFGLSFEIQEMGLRLRQLLRGCIDRGAEFGERLHRGIDEACQFSELLVEFRVRRLFLLLILIDRHLLLCRRLWLCHRHPHRLRADYLKILLIFSCIVSAVNGLTT